MNTESIGESAGKVWQALGSRGKLAVSALPKATGEESGRVQMGLGWLAREGKIELAKEGKSLVARLTDAELAAYRSAKNGS